MLTRSLATRYLPNGADPYAAYTWSTSQMQCLVNAGRLVNSVVNVFFTPFDVISGKAQLSHAANGVLVTVPYWLPAKRTSFNSNTINMFGTHLASMLKVPVVVNFVRLLTPVQDADVLAHFLTGELIDSTFLNTTRQLFSSIGPLAHRHSKTTQPGALIGLKVRLSGRLLKEASRPRQTIQAASIGSLTVFNNHSITAGSYTLSNLKGALTVKVWLCVKC